MTAAPHAVVTGGAGFVGSHLTDALLADGYRVTVLDNFGSGRRENLAHVDADRFECREVDVRSSLPTFDELDQVYHLASRASPEDFEFHSVEIALTNSKGTHNVFECARQHDATVLLASTSEVYGDPEIHPQHESYTGNVNLRGPRSPYDESKRFSEALAVAYEQQYDVDIRTVRIFNTYGPRMRADDGRVIPNFVTQALADEDLTVHGDGSQTRCFCYVSDLVAAIREFAELPREEAASEVINVGSENEITILELAEIVQSVADTDSDITYLSRPEDDPQNRKPDLTKARDVLGWEPTVDLRDGLRQCLDYFRAKQRTPERV